MEERTVTISLQDYTEMVIALERINALERFLENIKFPTIADVTAILGIKKENENETV